MAKDSSFDVVSKVDRKDAHLERNLKEKDFDILLEFTNYR